MSITCKHGHILVGGFRDIPAQHDATDPTINEVACGDVEAGERQIQMWRDIREREERGEDPFAGQFAVRVTIPASEESPVDGPIVRHVGPYPSESRADQAVVRFEFQRPSSIVEGTTLEVVPYDPIVGHLDPEVPLDIYELAPLIRDMPDRPGGGYGWPDLFSLVWARHGTNAAMSAWGKACSLLDESGEVDDDEEAAIDPHVVAQHNKPSGAWCRWSGSKTNRTDGVCPDRCAWTIPAADLTVKHIGRRIEAAVGTDEGVYQLDGLIVWITFTEDEVRIGVVEKPDSGANDWEFSHGDLVTIDGGK